MRPALVAACLLVGCNGDDEVLWTSFNAPGQTLSIEVTESDELGDPVGIDLTSTTGSTFVGVATVDPGSGPIGTDHRVEVLVDQAFASAVGRVTIHADAGDRGTTSHRLRQDSADHRLWVVSVTSLGDPGETRQDDFEVRLWTEAEEGDTGAVEEP